MKLDYIEPFVTSTMTVLGKILQSEVRQGDTALLPGRELTGDVGIMIGIRDEPGESIILNMDTQAALEICSAMNGIGFESMNDLGLDTLGEVANMIAGNAVTALNDRGLDFKVSPPAALRWEDISCVTNGLELFQVPVFSHYGKITVNFTMRTN